MVTRMQTLKIGAKGQDVKTLQKLLNEKINAGLNIDGCFGGKTKSAVKLYQTMNKIESDGVVGPMTWAKLQGSIADSGVKKPVDYKQYDKRWGGKLYTITGNRNQTMASSACGPTAMADIIATFFDNNITPYDLAQLAIKKNFRTVNSGTSWGFFKFIATQYEFTGFKQTTDNNAFLDALSKGALVVCSMGPSFWTKSGHFICAWKYENGYIYSNDPASSTRTKQKWSQFQKDRKQYFIFYPPIGWNEPVDDDEDVVVTPPPIVPEPPVEPSTPSAVIYSVGAKGQGVSDFQKKLSLLGYDLGAVDGIFGAKTKTALEKFQRDSGLPVSGDYDSSTKEKLDAAFAAKYPNGIYTGPTGIFDISKWQGSVNWSKVKASNKVGLMICRAGYGQNTKDTRFEEYMVGLKKYQIPYAAYWFSYATSVAGAEREAENFYKIASPHKPLFYVMDAEDRRVDGSYINAFAKKLRAISGGAKIGLYVANHLFSEYEKEGMNTSLWDFIWIPKYIKDSPPTHRPCDLWQYGGSYVNGFGGNIDSNKIPASGRFDIEWYLGLR